MGKSQRRARTKAVWRAGAIILTAMSGVVTNIVTNHWTWGLGAALGILVLSVAAIEMVVTSSEELSEPKVANASAPGAIAVGGDSFGSITTNMKNLDGGSNEDGRSDLR